MSELFLRVDTQPGKLCEPDSGRYPATSEPQLFAGNGDPLLVATNGKAICFVPVTVVGEVPVDRMPVSRKSLPTRKADRNIMGDLDTSGECPRAHWRYGDATYDSEPLASRFPKVVEIIPEWKGEKTLTIDARLLLDLALAITEVGEDAFVTLDISNPNGNTGIPVIGKKGCGVIMPISDIVGDGCDDLQRVKASLNGKGGEV